MSSLSAPLSLVLVVLLLGGTGLVLVMLRSRRRQMPKSAACGRCGYNVRGMPTFVCPECGADVREVGIRPPASPRRGGVFFLGLAMSIAALALLAGGTLSFYYRRRAAADRAAAIAARQALIAQRAAVAAQAQAGSADASSENDNGGPRAEAAP